MRLAAWIAALALALPVAMAPAVPAAASGLPPLGLERGQGSVGIGIMRATADVAVVDGVTLGADAYSFLYWNAVTARASWTTWQGPAGALGVLAAGGAGLFYSGGSVPFLQVGPVYETPPWPVRLRLALGSGIYAFDTTTYASGRIVAPGSGNWPISEDGPVTASGRRYDLAFQPVIEVVIPVGRHVELTLLGNGLAGIYGRW